METKIQGIILRRSAKGVPHTIVRFSETKAVSIVYKPSRQSWWVFEWLPGQDQNRLLCIQQDALDEASLIHELKQINFL